MKEKLKFILPLKLDITAKLNELIDAHNELEENYYNHYHQTGFESKESSMPLPISR